MKLFGRMSICGQISQYNATDKLKGNITTSKPIYKYSLI